MEINCKYCTETYDHNDKKFDIQIISVPNPLCKWFGLPQESFESIPNNHYRCGTLKRRYK